MALQSMAPDNDIPLPRIRKDGITILFDNTSTEASNIDIVFIHGLNGHPKDTWSHNVTGFFWPWELRKELETVRVMTFGYDASFDNVTKNFIRIKDIAAAFTDSLVNKRRTTEATVLASEAQASRANDLDKVYPCIGAFMFFGTPHGGSKVLGTTGAWILQKMARAAFRQIPPKLERALEQNSDELLDLADSFRKVSLYVDSQLLISTYFEQKATVFLNERIVDPASASIQYARADDARPINADHVGMVKFENNEDGNYEDVLGRLQRWVEKLTIEDLNIRQWRRSVEFKWAIEISFAGHEWIVYMLISRVGHPVVAGKAEELAECMRAMYEIAGNYENQRAQIDTPIPETCQWILSHCKYEAWISAEQSALLWVTADAGCGKSVLAGFLSDTLEETHPSLICPFFFKSGLNQRNDLRHALCALLHRILSNRLALVRCLIQDFRQKGPAFLSDVRRLWDIVCTMTLQRDCPPILWILDAIDECTKSARDQLIQFLASTFSQQRFAGSFKVLVTSRPYYEIQALFTDKTIRLRGEDEASSVSLDVERLIHFRIEEMKDEGFLSPNIYKQVLAHLIQRADRTFLWATLVFESLRNLSSRSESEVLRAVQRLPPTLDKFYEDALESSRDRDACKRLLQIILVATRPLSLDEVNIALNIKEDKFRVRDLCAELEPDIEFRVKNLAGYFIRIVNSRVFFIHETARDFLLRTDVTNISYSWKGSLTLPGSNLTLAKICISFLIQDEWSLPSSVRGAMIPSIQFAAKFLEVPKAFGVPFMTFFEYSAHNWFVHLEEGDLAMEPITYPILFRLYNPKFLGVWWSFYADRGFYAAAVNQKHYYLHHIVARGHFSVLRSIEKLPFFNIYEDSRGQGVLEIAAIKGHEKIVRWLLSNHDRAKLHCTEALVLATKYRNVPIMKTLLEAGLNSNECQIISSIGRAVLPPPTEAEGSWAQVLTTLRNAKGIEPEDFLSAATYLPFSHLKDLFQELKNMHLFFRWMLLNNFRLWIITFLMHRHDPRKYILQDALRALKDGHHDAMFHLLETMRKDIRWISERRRLNIVFIPEGKHLWSDFFSTSQHTLEMGILELFHPVTTHDQNPWDLSGKKSLKYPEQMPQNPELNWELFSRPETVFEYLDDLEPRRQDIFLLVLQTLATMKPKSYEMTLIYAILVHEGLAIFMFENSQKLGGEFRVQLVAPLVCLTRRTYLLQLMCRTGLDVNQNDSFGISPLLAAVASGDEDIIQYLITLRARPDEPCHAHFQEDEYGMSNSSIRFLRVIWQRVFLPSDPVPLLPIGLAARSRQKNIVKLLMANGASPWQEALLSYKPFKGKASQCSVFDVAARDLFLPELLQWIIQNSKDVSHILDQRDACTGIALVQNMRNVLAIL
ncbi:ankyrin repeat protein, partial [Metarhizium robertsii]